MATERRKHGGADVGGGALGSRKTPPREGRAAEGAPDVPRWSFPWWRENIEAFLFAVVLAIIIRHFSLEAFEIPTGSMANTLLGMHAWTECPNCGTQYPIALPSNSATGRIALDYRSVTVYRGACPNPRCRRTLHLAPYGANREIACGACGSRFAPRWGPRYANVEAVVTATRCPICHHVARDTVIEKRNRYGGHKILVTKFAYVLGPPKRWDVIVFEFDQWKNYIKRLVGLPGERIDVWDGDVYVNGKIARKHEAPHAQASLWTRISDTDVAEGGLNPTPAWSEVSPRESRRARDVPKDAEWDPAVRRWKVNAAGDFAALRYQRPVDNYYSYNLLSRAARGVSAADRVRGFPADVSVGDRKVAFTVRAEPPPPRPGGESLPSWVGAEIRDGDFAFQLRLPAGGASESRPATLARLEADPGPGIAVERKPHPSDLRAARAVSVPWNVPVRIEFENLDDRVAARLDGKEILALEYTSLPEGALERPAESRPRPPSGPHELYLIVANALAELSSIRVYRDVYYIARVDSEPWRGIQLGEHEYFAMGDNSPSSSDGRYWGSVPEENLIGKAFFVFWPAWPTNFQMKIIR